MRGWVGGRVDGWRDGWVGDGWIGGWMDELDGGADRLMNG